MHLKFKSYLKRFICSSLGQEYVDTIEIISSFPKINKIDDLFHQSNEKQTILPQKFV